MTTFPYIKSQHGGYFPVIKINIYHNTKLSLTSALVDSGASTSIFTKDIAESLGIKIEKGQEVFMNGVGGRIKGYTHKLTLEIADKTIIAPIIFSYEYLVSFNLIGRDGIFENFKITFDEKNLKLIFQ